MMIQCCWIFFLNLPQEADGLESPLQEHMAEKQAADEELQDKLSQRSPDQYHVRQRQGHIIVYYMRNGDHNNMQLKIALPRNVIPQTFTPITPSSDSQAREPQRHLETRYILPSAVTTLLRPLRHLPTGEVASPWLWITNRVRTITYWTSWAECSHLRQYND